MKMRINLDGNILELRPLGNKETKGLWPEARWTFSFFGCSSNGVDFVVPSIKSGKTATPRQLEHYAQRLESFFGKQVVFMLPEVPRYQRVRYAERGLFYIIPQKEYARLPFLFAGKKMSDRIKAKQLTPVAQYLLLFQLQKGGLDGKSVSEICELVPQSYLTVSRAITTLEDVGLCESVRHVKNKIIHFKASGKELWDLSQQYLISPVRKVFYLDAYGGSGILGGINALSHYTNLNPEEIQTKIVLRDNTLRKNQLEDGDIRIEVWKYPPMGNGQWADKLSLALSLRDEKDERVQKEVEKMVKTVWCTE